MAYKEIKIPDDKPPEKYNHLQRRAEILKLILESGHPGLLSQTQLAKRYKVSQPAIWKDFQAIKKEITDNIGDDAELVTRTVYEKGVKEYLKKGDFRNAWRLVQGFNTWLFDSGIKIKAAEKHEINGSLNSEQLQELFEKHKKKKV